MAIIEIDQSGKWEGGRPTAIGVAIDNKSFYGSLITAQNKNLAKQVRAESREKGTVRRRA